MYKAVRDPRSTPLRLAKSLISGNSFYLNTLLHCKCACELCTGICSLLFPHHLSTFYIPYVTSCYSLKNWVIEHKKMAELYRIVVRQDVVTIPKLLQQSKKQAVVMKFTQNICRYSPTLLSTAEQQAIFICLILKGIAFKHSSCFHNLLSTLCIFFSLQYSFKCSLLSWTR